jgi:hypothetical protein
VSIPFRTQRLATSVVNRILNVADGIFPPQTPGGNTAPDPLMSGRVLDQELYNTQPKAPTDAAPGEASQIALSPLVK